MIKPGESILRITLFKMRLPLKKALLQAIMIDGTCKGNGMRYFPRGIVKLFCFLMLLSFFPFLVAMGTHNSPPPEPMSLETLFQFCGLPDTCDHAVAWEGRTVSIQGMVDAVNIFDKAHYPRLPYEKFTLTDGRHTVEVWPQAKDNEAIFEKLARRPEKPIVVTGQLAAIKLPTSHQCTWGVKVLIHEPSHIEF
jgi:hypothetical protein